MWFRSLFDALSARPSRTPARGKCPAPSIRRRPRAVPPLLEVLEDRTVLSTYTVNALTDTGAGSGQTGDLRYCVTHATSGSDTITFAPGLSGTIQLQSALPTLNAGVDIQGPGASQLTVECDPADSSFNALTVGSAANVQISGLTISDFGDAGIDNYNYGSVIISDSTLSGNRTGLLNNGTAVLNNCTITGGFGVGGAGIHNSGALTLNNSTISGNVDQGYTGRSSYAGEFAYSGGDGLGGGIYMAAGTLTINSSTIANNEAVGGDVSGSGFGLLSGVYGGNGYGGGLYVAGGTVSINNSTFADNQTQGGFGLGYEAKGSGYGGGIYNAAGPSALQMHDTILADNNADTAYPDLEGSLTSLGHNLIGNSSGGSGFATSDLLNVNPDLGQLQNNGGPTPTMALLDGSPAIDAGDNSNAPAYDQRGPGFPRIVGGTIDIGAFEVQSGSPTPTPTPTPASSLAVSGFPSPTQAGAPGSFTVTAQNADGSTDTGYTGTVHFSSSDGQAGLPPNYTFTSADAGTHTFNATLKTAGTQSLTATDTTTAGITGTDGGIAVQPAAASKFVLSGPSSVTHGVPFSLKLTAQDPYGNIATGYTGTVHLSSTDSTATLPANYTFTAGDAGVHTFTGLVLHKRGTQKITATDTHNSSLTATDTISVG